MADVTLFQKSDLEDLLQRRKQALPPGVDPSTVVDDQTSIDDGTYTVIHKVVNGLLLDAAHLQVWPDPLPPQVFSWAVELGAISCENPAGAAVDGTDRVTLQWNEQRRNAILASARDWGNQIRDGDVVPSPKGCFPPATRLPHDLEHRRRRYGGDCW